jgi:DNA adenine methylase
MATAHSPLRYPGGKSCLFSLVSGLVKDNKLQRCHYAEPFAGGAGLALSLLYAGHVSDIHINDVDPAIWAFWHSVLNDTEKLCYKIAKTPVTVEEWRHQKTIFGSADVDDPLSLGFSAFFLNRTNRSGIIKDAGIIGGLEQKGNYKIDCRFNREGLIGRVRRISKYKNRIHLYRRDALAFIEFAENSLPKETFFCVDPPYFKKGSKLYTSFYNPEDHAILADAIIGLDRPWMVTYDNVPEITMLYRARRQFEFDINYSIETKRKGTEVLIASKGLRVPIGVRSRQINRPQYRAA